MGQLQKKKMKVDTITRNALRKEEAIRKLVAQGEHAASICEALNISKASLLRYSKLLGITVPRKKSTATGGIFNTEAMTVVIALRKKGHTLAEIASNFGVTKERIRQVLSTHSPDLVLATRAAITKPCSVCGTSFHGPGKTCSKECSTLARRKNTWNRDKFENLMSLRDLGYTWPAVAFRLGDVHSGSWRIKMGRAAQTILTKAECLKYLPPRCSTSTETDSSLSDGTKESAPVKCQQDGLNGPRRTSRGSRLLSWLTKRF
jgi:predicted nucleic acid-binding Zn ribbon protein